MSALTISVIIPTHDRPERLAECLRALAAQDFPRDRWEAVVVDDGTPDSRSVTEVIDSVRGSLDVHLLSQPQTGPAAARNHGAAHARFEYLAFTDDDCRPTPRWLSELAAAIEREPDSLHGGCTVNGVEQGLCSEASHQLVDYVVHYFLERGEPFFPSNNIVLSRAAFEQIGGFDMTFPRAAGEDRDFCAKCRTFGLPILPAPEAVVDHRHPLTIRKFFRQHFNYGRGAYLYHRLEAERGERGLRVEPLMFYVNLMRAPWGAGRPAGGRIRIAALLLLSQIANAAGFFAERFGFHGAQKQPSSG